MNDKDILKFDLLHPLDKPESFYQRLNKSVTEATTIRGAVAYWTITPDFIATTFPQLVANDGSFLCVDIHLPTSVEMLRQLSTQVEEVSEQPSICKPAIYIHLRDLEGQTEIRDANSEMPEHLLHSKTMLFNFADDTAEIWIGSHNWTRRSMVGVNIETTLVLRVSTRSELYRQTQHMLEEIRRICQPFDPRLVDYYKWLQGKVRPKAFFELEGVQAEKLAKTDINLFGTEPAEFASLKTVGNQICMAVRDLESDVEYLYEASISTASDSKNDIATIAQNLQTNDQRFVFREGRCFPKIELPLKSEDPNPIQNAAYGATIRVHKLLSPNTRVFSIKANDLWFTTDDDFMLTKLDILNEDRLIDVNEGYLRGVREILQRITLRVAAPIDADQLQEPDPRTPKDANSRTNHALFTRRLIKTPEKKKN